MDGAVRRLCELSHQVFQNLGREIRPHEPTRALARRCRSLVDELGGGAAQLRHLHINVNEEAFHTPPGEREVLPGDILTVDLVLTDGTFFSDGAWTYPAGELSPPRRELLARAWAAARAGVLSARAGGAFRAVQEAAAEALGGGDFILLPEACGHGVGRALHEEPEIPFGGSPSAGRFPRGELFCTIEPVVVSKGAKLLQNKDKGAFFVDRGDAAYFEHMLYLAPGKRACLNIPEINMREVY